MKGPTSEPLLHPYPLPGLNSVTESVPVSTVDPLVATCHRRHGDPPPRRPTATGRRPPRPPSTPPQRRAPGDPPPPKSAAQTTQGKRKDWKESDVEKRGGARAESASRDSTAHLPVPRSATLVRRFSPILPMCFLRCRVGPGVLIRPHGHTTPATPL